VVEVDVAGGGTAPRWVGDRWQQSWDGLKSHDPQYLYPLQFDAQGVVAKVPWVDTFTLDVV
jgi:hypothetical protein